MHACNRVLRVPIKYAESPNRNGDSTPNLFEETDPLRAIEPVKVRCRSMRCHAH